MITIPEVVESIIKQSPLLSEGLSQGLINTSALARKIKKEVENRSRKLVTEGAIIMAIQRLSSQLASSAPSFASFQNTPDMIVRSNLFEYTVKNSPTLIAKQKILLDEISHENKYFVTITNGVFETTIIASSALRERIKEIFKKEEKFGEIPALSSITIRLTPEIVNTPGSYVQILKFLAWEGINIIEVVSTYLELTIILSEQDIDRAFSILKKSY